MQLYNIFMAVLLKGVNPLKKYGTFLFEALARLTVSVSLEAVCVRRDPDTAVIQIALTQRATTESFSPGSWHFPGSFYRPWESSARVLRRLIGREFGRLEFLQAAYVGTYRTDKAHKAGERGHTHAEVWLILEAQVSGKVLWFDHNDLPDSDMFYSHKVFVFWAVEAFERWEKGQPIARQETIRPSDLSDEK